MKVFITGVTGTLGTAIAKLHLSRGDAVYGCARSEYRATEWLANNPVANQVHLMLSNLDTLLNSPYSQLKAVIKDINKVYHCAAMKHVDMCEQFPEEAVYQNYMLTAMMATTCQHRKIPFVLASTDKACLPENVYGATKLLAERVTMSSAGYVVRLGNLIGSSGSVFQKWKQAIDKKESIKVTNKSMTRYFIPVDEAAAVMARDDLWLNQINVPDMQAVNMGIVASAIAPNDGYIEVIGLRAGETLHQWLVAPGELANGKKWMVGLSSSTANRWSLVDLLKEAGISKNYDEKKVHTVIS